MKGLVFNLLEEAVRAAHGEKAWDVILDRAGVDGAYTSVGNYDDDELLRLVNAACETLHLGDQELLRWFGRAAIPAMAQRYPQFFEQPDTRSFLLTLNNVIHAEVRKLYPGAHVPRFAYEPSDSAALLMRYDSKRRMCAFAEGLIEGAAARFGETAEIVQRECMLRGDARCLLQVTLLRGGHA